jgi:hypothetical protein
MHLNRIATKGPRKCETMCLNRLDSFSLALLSFLFDAKPRQTLWHETNEQPTDSPYQ